MYGWVFQQFCGLFTQVQNNKQSISTTKSKIATNINQYKEIATGNHRINPNWTQDELLLAVQGEKPCFRLQNQCQLSAYLIVIRFRILPIAGIRNFGKDFQTIADIIGTKTRGHVKSFYINYRKRYNLDLLLQDHEKEFGHIVDSNDSTDSNKIDKVILRLSSVFILFTKKDFR